MTRQYRVVIRTNTGIGPETLLERVQAIALRRGNRTAIVGPEGCWTYRAVIEHSLAVAARLPDKAGTVALIMGNEPAFLIALLGVWAAGGTALVVDPRWTRKELSLAFEEHPPTSVMIGDTTPPEVVEYAQRWAPAVRAATTPLWSGPFVPDHPDPDTPALVLFTAGSAGRPKSVVHSHRGLLAGADALVRHRRRLQRSITPRRAIAIIRQFPTLPRRAWRARRQLGWMTPLGFYTISGISVVSQALLSGGRIATAWPFSPETAWQAIGSDQANVLAVSPSMLEAMLNRRNPGDGTSLLVVGVGAAAASPSLLARSEAELGCPVVVGYGSTELGGGVLATDPWDRERAPGEVGSALEGCDWRIVDPSGHTVPHGSIGELAHRSPGMMLGYQTLGNTTWADREGWYRTGDLAVADASGSIRIEGRIDDRISRGGLNIYPSEIERILRSHPEVDECAVVGQPTRSGEHEILAFVSPTPGSTPQPEALARWCANSLAPQKLPDRIEITATLPRTDAGEVRKANLLQGSPKPSLPRSVGLGQRDPDGRPRIER